jgi:hypothetical protein
MRQNPSLSGPLKASRRLSVDLWRLSGCRVAPYEGFNPHRTAADSHVASFNLRSS